MTIHWKAVEQYLFFIFSQCIILKHLSILDFALSEVKVHCVYRASARDSIEIPTCTFPRSSVNKSTYDFVLFIKDSFKPYFHH